MPTNETGCLGCGDDDGTRVLCVTLYGEERPEHYLGGSNARMLHDAAECVSTLRARVAELEGQLASARSEAETYRACIGSPGQFSWESADVD